MFEETYMNMKANLVYLRPDLILEVNCSLSMNLIPGIELID